MEKFTEWLLSEEARLLWIYAPDVYDEIAKDKAKELIEEK